MVGSIRPESIGPEEKPQVSVDKLRDETTMKMGELREKLRKELEGMSEEERRGKPNRPAPEGYRPPGYHPDRIPEGAKEILPGVPTPEGKRPILPGVPTPEGKRPILPGVPTPEGKRPILPGVPTPEGKRPILPGVPTPEGKRPILPGLPTPEGKRPILPGVPTPEGKRPILPGVPTPKAPGGILPGRPTPPGAEIVECTRRIADFEGKMKEVQLTDQKKFAQAIEILDDCLEICEKPELTPKDIKNIDDQLKNLPHLK